MLEILLAHPRTWLYFAVLAIVLLFAFARPPRHSGKPPLTRRTGPTVTAARVRSSRRGREDPAPPSRRRSA
jgi:hypothetical protein